MLSIRSSSFICVNVYFPGWGSLPRSCPQALPPVFSGMLHLGESS